MSNALQAAASRLENWIKDQALPLWLARGISPEGGHYERLDVTGAVDLAANPRVRVQARQAFFFASAYVRGWCPQGLAVAEHTLAFVNQHAAHPNGGFTHLMNPQWQVIDSKQDLYDHAFFLLANAWCYRASGKAQYLQAAEQLVAYLDAQFASVKGGWREGDYDYSCRRQNPHMHLLEAFLALYDASGDGKWLARAGEIFGLFQAHFYDAPRKVLLEFFAEDWSRLSDARGEQIEPGHMMEWVWLLDWYSRSSGAPVAHYTNALYERALQIGIAPSGLLFDAITPDGTLVDGRKRCWGITELIKASLVQIRAGHPQAVAIAVKAVDDLFTYYLCASTPGSYVDQRGLEDDVVADNAPASTLYHIMVAAMELADHIKRG